MDNTFIDPFPNIPNELKDYKQWVNYILVEKTLKDGTKKFSKPPANDKGQLIAIDNNNNFNNYINVCNAVGVNGVVGIGFVFTESDSFVGVDLDGVIFDNKLNPDASFILRVLNSYTELSVSGTGIHIICKCTDEFIQQKNRKGFLEIYKNGRYFTFSGKSLKGTPDTINERSKELQYIHDKYLFNAEEIKEHKGKNTLLNMPTSPINKAEPIKEHQEPQNKLTPATQVNKTDAQYLKEGLERGKRLNSLMQGHRTTNDESQNDYFLIQELAYWSNCNIDLIKRAFYYSTHYNTKDQYHKKKALSNYLDKTIEQVIKKQRTTARIKDEKNKREYKTV